MSGKWEVLFSGWATCNVLADTWEICTLKPMQELKQASPFQHRKRRAEQPCQMPKAAAALHHFPDGNSH